MKHLTPKIEKWGFLHELSYVVYGLKKPNQLVGLLALIVSSLAVM